MAELIAAALGGSSAIEALGCAGMTLGVAKFADFAIDWVIVDKVLKCATCAGAADVAEVARDGYPAGLISFAIVVAVFGTIVEVAYAWWRKRTMAKNSLKGLSRKHIQEAADSVADDEALAVCTLLA